MAASPYISTFSQSLSDFGLSQSKYWPADTLCITIAGANTAQTAILKFKACFPDSIVGFISNPKFSNIYFVKYALDLMKTRLRAVTRGATQDNLSMDKLLSFGILAPPVEVQNRVGGLLAAYDDLIEVNRRRIAVLETMARGLFEEWFVRFRFPGHDNIEIADTPEGGLPEGWTWAMFGDFADEIRESVSPSDLSADTPYVGLEHLPRRSTTLDSYGRADEVGSLKLRFQRGDVLFGKIRPYFHKVAWAPFAGVASSDAMIFRAKRRRDVALVVSVASSDDFVAKAVQTSNGTKMPRANPSVLRVYGVPSPPPAILEQFQSIALPTIELAASLQSANQTLAAARDLLLPRLISGELSVAAASGELEAAA